ncbi:MobP2 family relaxase [Fructobacillus fructosus]|uniref:Uncharacterized protein n=1 Tax=Fructobacillus fructosus TaxID=1631 RepID=A0ABM9MP31_9LACO|nr:MobP2 family relaxase [Fructobacillus fructosus]MBC9119438.1 hypothetical protein [Fructobacillus fructosus]MBD9367037.1 hypothetical protein [Leuconostoc mesenteroides]CAK1230035.1 hypothetical protein R54839_PPFHFPJH_00384 [Fructobacillus fructosus]
MAKTGGLSNFKVDEKNTGAVIMPTQFVRAKSANAKGQQYGDLINYAEKNLQGQVRAIEENNHHVSEVNDLKKHLQEEGYATRSDAVTEKHPLFDAYHNNLNDDQVSQLKSRLNEAQANGNNLHEVAFSMRGDWLIKNNLFDPKTKTLDQTKLKEAERAIVQTLADKGFAQPLGETPEDLVWFGVIHQDTDHLNMHLWMAKVSPETRPDMLVQKGDYRGEPRGAMRFSAMEQAQSQFQSHLRSDQQQANRNQIFKTYTTYEKDLLKSSFEKSISQDRYTQQLQDIYQALPPDRQGKWQVGNSQLEATGTQMSLANHRVNEFLDDLFANELKEPYEQYKKAAFQVDALQEAEKGQLRQGQKTWSDNKESQLRKRFANKLYRSFNEAVNENEEPQNSTPNAFDEQLNRVRQRMQLEEKKKARSSRQAKDHDSRTGHQRTEYTSDSDRQGKENLADQSTVFNSQSPLKKQQGGSSKSDKADWQEKHNSPLSPKTIKNIRRVFQKSVQDDLEAERRFMLRQQKLKQEEYQEEIEEVQQSRGQSL